MAQCYRPTFLLSTDMQIRYEGDQSTEQKVYELQAEMEEIKRFQRVCEQDKDIATRMQLAEKMMTHATNYTNLMLVAGYAGFFGFWSSIVTRLPQWVYAVSGLLALVSLLLFISWEITKMVSSYRRLNITNEMIKKAKRGDNTLAMQDAAAYLHSIKMNKRWKWFLIPTVTAAISAALLLLGTFVYQIWKSIF